MAGVEGVGRAQPRWKLGDSKPLISVPPAGTSFTPFSALGSLLILVQEGLVGAVVVPLETSEPRSAATSLEGGFWGGVPQYLEGLTEAVRGPSSNSEKRPLIS